MERTFKHIESRNSSIEELICGLTTFSEKHPNLQVFLHSEGEYNYLPYAEFLMVTPDSFGKVVVRDLTYEDPYINITIHDCATKRVGIVRIDIHDVNQKVFFVSWQAIKYIWREERKSIMADLNNLEFDF